MRNKVPRMGLYLKKNIKQYLKYIKYDSVYYVYSLFLFLIPLLLIFGIKFNFIFFLFHWFNIPSESYFSRVSIWHLTVLTYLTSTHKSSSSLANATKQCWIILSLTFLSFICVFLFVFIYLVYIGFILVLVFISLGVFFFFFENLVL